jgi:DNA-binding beta-propeller fold protein YncE
MKRIDSSAVVSQPHTARWHATGKNWSGILAALIAAISTAPAFGAVSVNPNISYYYGEGPGEGVSVSSDGKFIMVSSPINISGETNYSSFVPHLVHTPLAPEPFHLTRDFPLTGLGEVTDVGVMPGGPFGLAVVRADALHPFNGMVAIRGNEILQSIPIPHAPDGMKISPDGRYAIVAVEKGGDIRIYDLEGGAGKIEIAAIITKEAIAAQFVNVPNPVNAAEPEAVGISSDSSFALVTLQDCSSLVSLSLDDVTLGRQQGLAPEQIGDIALKKVLHLPFGFVGRNGALFGVEPDGVGISPDGNFAILAHEANNNARHLAGISIIDLRNGLANMTAQTYSVFDLDPTLLANTGLSSVPIVAPGAPYPTAATRLPRLDVASVEIVHRGGQLVAAVVIERYDPSPAQISASTSNETRGSVLFLDVAQALNGSFTKIDRLSAGVSGSRLEVIDSAQGGRWIFVSISNGGGDRGTFARFELLNQ